MKTELTQTIEILNMKPQNEMFGLLRSLQASQMIYSDKENFVMFKVKGDRGINKVKVILNAMDTFDVEFWNIRDITCNRKDEIKDIYNDSLVQAIWNRVVLV